MGQVQQVVLGGVARPERRKHPRFMCTIPVEIRLPGVSYPSQGETTDISLGGCYISSRFNMSVGTKIELKLWVGDVGVKTQAIVRTSDPGVGNGMEFLGLDSAGEQVLGEYLAKVEAMPHDDSEKSLRDLLIT